MRSVKPHINRYFAPHVSASAVSRPTSIFFFRPGIIWQQKLTVDCNIGGSHRMRDRSRYPALRCRLSRTTSNFAAPPRIRSKFLRSGNPSTCFVAVVELCTHRKHNFQDIRDDPSVEQQQRSDVRAGTQNDQQC